MKNLFFLFLILGFAACNDSSEKKEPAPVDSTAADRKTETEPGYVHRFADTALENKITTALLKLPFVQKSNAYIDSLTNHKHGITFLLDSAGNSENEISVQAGYNGSQRFETYYRFYVDPKSLAVKVYDQVADKKLTVKEYLKSQK